LTARTPQRESRITDTRIHAVIYFITPSGHSLSPLDIIVMKKIAKLANIIPVIAKGDSLTPSELAGFKKRVQTEIEFHGIKFYPTVDFEDEFTVAGSEAEKSNKEAFQKLKVLLMHID
jgi:septin 3/9/12